MNSDNPRLSVIIPVYNDRDNLAKCLDSLERSSFSEFELVLVDDGSSDGSATLAEQRADVFLGLERNMGQAEARNRGAALARSDLFFFLDADVMVASDTLEQIIKVMDDNPEFSAMFCSYQPDTPHDNFTSQYKNLLHHFTHQQSRSEAVTFCGGFGAIRREVFLQCQGFDKDRRFMEDVDLGYRLHQAGHRTLSCPWIQLTHNKRYSLGSLIRSDVLQRAIPWTHVMLQRRMFQNDLNTSNRNIISLLLVFGMILLLFLPRLSLSATAMLEVAMTIALIWLNREFLGFVKRQKGMWFAVRALGMIFIQHLYSGLGLVMGVLSYGIDRLRGR